ncbi:MAG: Cytosolic iron-sulfur protein assembly protein [Geoglossum umbratile]|nr:MAG: Cytosolic iron-sulfur protein assembly protein [Geoglossum umbratile]
MSTAKLCLLAPFTPPSLARTWSSQPHHSLPLLATASSDKSVRIYSLTSFTLISTIEGGHKRSIRSTAWKPGTKGESVLATGSFDSSAGIWRRWDNDMVPRPERQEREIGSGSNGEEEEDDEEEWRFAVVLDGHESEVKSVAWSAGGNFLATCSRDKSVWIWEEMEDDNFETIAVLQEHEGDVKCVVWHPEEELLASSSYDDTIRLYKEDIDDWACISVLKGHNSTVWSIDFEPPSNPSLLTTGDDLSLESTRFLERRSAAGPRLISSSDDLTIRVWSRVPRDMGGALTGHSKVPSSIRTGSVEEEWVEEAQLPRTHTRAIYSAAWSKRTGRVVSAGGDGKIVVYEERWRSGNESPIAPKGDHPPADAGSNQVENDVQSSATRGGPATDDISDSVLGAEGTEWVVLAEMPAAHGVYEVNHVCWAKRFDKGRAKDEEIIISTGDDGVVKAWTLGS